MKGLKAVAVAVALGFLISVPSLAWAAMEHQGGGCGMQCGSQHMGMTEHQGGTDGMFDNYFAIHTALAGDSLEGVSDKATALAEAVEKFDHDTMNADDNAHGKHMHETFDGIATSAHSLADAEDIDAARNEFGKLSEHMVEYHKMHADHHSSKGHAFVCDMAQKVWLQEGEEPHNPYYGSAMLGCGRKL
jgi:hypothetical protein